ncbi:hypothetical protein MPTK1_3g05930 [Marchantia polymorpha subsp. ruderalis]|uniref:Uncharacterized protein n=2 Tax=Marchantia polymorpha TaxID=3197 RepID=A0AAF6AXV4_MARPO|nr:hypothetical protein MARPO_0006s0063 [Marchantia polymorpha]BBN04588.1 hypothetical protein Mp_3g05930 [Marchantia polymorpha subsp. ruderalis]|eukprot:PTQ48024.1 hypothetical protein MARPO_0006s0063 [Marchantia polymorpha]
MVSRMHSTKHYERARYGKDGSTIVNEEQIPLLGLVGAARSCGFHIFPGSTRSIYSAFLNDARQPPNRDLQLLHERHTWSPVCKTSLAFTVTFLAPVPHHLPIPFRPRFPYHITRIDNLVHTTTLTTSRP